MLSSAWARLWGVLLIVGLFYIGHGLHLGGAAPALVNTATADDRFNIDPPVPAYPVPKGFRWEKLPRAGDEPQSFRAKLPGGWLVATVSASTAGGPTVHTVFVDDVYHWWELR